VPAACVTGETPKAERQRVLEAFKRGELRALTNANVLTTGFDAPNIDLIAMLRPTLSPSLYVQMAGRGLRPKSHTDHCLVLDFAGVVATHGPITAVQPPDKAGEGDGEAPVKVCDECGELVHPTARTCPSCGFVFPLPPEKKFALRNDDIMGAEGSDLIVTEWEWRRHVSASSGLEMLRVRYYGGIAEKPIDEYLTIAHPGYAGDKARRTLATIAQNAGTSPGWALDDNLDAVAAALNDAKPPRVVTFERDGKFFRVKRREW
jgi:DNA repair protein RadD